PLGCLLFAASAWALLPRDEWIGWTKTDRSLRLNLIVNNTRFLIFPWVRIKNLASKVLSLAVKRIGDDWQKRYGYRPLLLETFVDPEKYPGTSYRAANWTYLGQTKGRGRMDRYKKRALTRKDIYVYSLRADFHSLLKGE
ncbi:MAG: Druantia anti-phage system protein DruA, partial [Dethiobacteria bacterium]